MIWLSIRKLLINLKVGRTVMGYRSVRNHVDEIARKFGRLPEEIELVTVSKNQSLSSILQTYQEGCRDFGESRIQDALEKIDQLPDDIRWHFIGTLQRNKVPQTVGRFQLIHSVDSFELLKKISQTSEKLGKETSVLLQVNTSGESTKHGLPPDDWRELFDRVVGLPMIRVLGLMTMAPLTEDEASIRDCFRRLRLLRDEFRMRSGGAMLFEHLSMGMSHDYPIAIEEGATLLRIGSAIFG